MIYGVDIDYKAVIIASLTLTLSTLQHKPKNTKLPQLIGRTLIHQNALIDAAPYYKREKIFGKYKPEIARLRKLKTSDFEKFVKLRDELTEKIIPKAGSVANYADSLKIGCIELALPEVYFNEDGSLNIHGGMDIVIGNPPWEVWKSNSDEFFSEYDPSYRKLPNKTAKKKLEASLEQRFSNIATKWDENQKRVKTGSKYFRDTDSFQFQTWKVNGRKTSADLNLYKISLERFTQLAKSESLFSILVPDNFATDNGSTGVRHLVIDHYELCEYLSFTNRAKVFRAVTGQQKFAVLTFTGRHTGSKMFKAFFYQKNLDRLTDDEAKLNYSLKFLKRMEPERYAMVESRNEDLFKLFRKIRTTFPALRDSHLIRFSRDFDANKESNKFIKAEEQNKEAVNVYEGKTIGQFRIKPEKVRFGVNIETMQSKSNDDYKYYRLAFRNIARATDKRSLIATLLPYGSTGTYSIWIQRECSDMSLSQQLFILGFMNSYVLDFMIRQLVTVNINLPFSSQLPIPKFADIGDSSVIVQIVKELLKENGGYYQDLDRRIKGNDYQNYEHNDLVAELNARIMIDFNLKRQEIIMLMHTFESAKYKKIVQQETQRILDKYDELSKGGQNE